MANPDHVIKLISSIDRKYRSVLPSAKGKENSFIYEKLCDWIKKQKSDYTREGFIKRHPEYTEKQVRSAEDHLFNTILERLSARSDLQSSLPKINQLITQAIILEQKGLYEKALERLRAAEQQAHKYHHYALLMEIIPMRINVIIYKEEEDRAQEIDQAYQDLEQVSAVLQQETQLRRQNALLMLEYERFHNLDQLPPALIAQQKELVEAGFPQDGSFFAQYYFYSIQAIYARIEKRYVDANSFQEQAVQLWDAPQYDVMKKEHLQLYMTQLANQASYYIVSGKVIEAQETIEKLEQLSPSNYDEEVEQLQNLLFYKQLLYLNTHQFDQAAALVESIQDALDEHEYRINPRRRDRLRHNSIIALFFNGDIPKANALLSNFRYLNDQSPYHQSNFQFIKVFEILILYMLKSEESLEYKIKSIPKGKLNVLEKALIDTLRKLKALRGQARVKDSIRQLHEELLAQLNEEFSPEQKKTIGYGEVKLWLERRIKNDDFTI